MANVPGSVAAGLQLAGRFLWLSKKLGYYIKAMRDAPEQILDVKRETFIFSVVFTEFHSVAEDVFDGIDPESEEMYYWEKALKAMVSQGNLTMMGIKRLLRKVQDLANTSSVGELIGRFMWAMKGTRVKGLLDALNSVKLNVIMVTGTLTCKLLRARIERLLRENKEVPAKLKKKM